MSNGAEHWCRGVVTGALAMAEGASGPSGGGSAAAGSGYNPAAVLMRPPPLQQQYQQYPSQTQRAPAGISGYGLGASASSHLSSSAPATVAGANSSSVVVPAAYAAHMTPEAYQAYMQQYYQNFYS
jgi:hypothetical protein